MHKGQRGLAPITVIITIAIIFGVGYFALRSPEEKITIKNEAMTATPEMMGGESETVGGQNTHLTESGNLQDFTKTEYEKAIASDKLVALYFYANWCPICRAEFPKAINAFNQLEGENVIGFRVNYNDDETNDDERNLAREFGVAYQHTKVFIKGGERVLKAPDTWEAARYISEIRNHLE